MKLKSCCSRHFWWSALVLSLSLADPMAGSGYFWPVPTLFCGFVIICLFQACRKVHWSLNVVPDISDAALSADAPAWWAYGRPATSGWARLVWFSQFHHFGVLSSAASFEHVATYSLKCFFSFPEISARAQLKMHSSITGWLMLLNSSSWPVLYSPQSSNYTRNLLSDNGHTVVTKAVFNKEWYSTVFPKKSADLHKNTKLIVSLYAFNINYNMSNISVRKASHQRTNPFAGWSMLSNSIG